MKKVSLDTTKSVALSPTGGTAGGPIAILPVLDLIPQLEPFERAAENVEEQAARAIIDSEQAYQKGTDFLTVCQDQWQQLEDLRRTVKGPIDDYAKFIQSIFLPIQARFLVAKSGVSGRMLMFYKAEQQLRQKQQDEQRRANEEAAQRLAEEAEARGESSTASAILDIATAAPVPVAAPRIGASNSFGRSTNVTKRWTASVEKPMEVLQAIIDGRLPISLLEWKQVELNKVATTLKVEKVVNGLKIYQSESLQQR